MPAITDKFNQATTTGRPSPAALTAVKTIGATSITVDSTAEWPTDTAVHFIIYEVDANNDKVAGTQCDFKGIVNSATTINNLTLKAGTDREYPIGSKVIAAPTAAWADDVVEGLAVSLNQDGTMKESAVRTALNLGSSSTTGWEALAETVSVSTGYNSGNRSFEITTSADISDTVSPGMRFKATRNTTPPTQCADLEASSSHYASLASGSVSGITFTDDFTVEAWVKLESYASMYIASRFSGSSGWGLRLSSAGAVEIVGFNASGGNYGLETAYQSIPLGKWVHVATSLNMSSDEGLIYIDGVLVPSVWSQGGTNPTALVQAGNLEVGSANAGTFFDGKLADVRVWSDIRTATEIQDNMYAYPSDTTGLVAHFKLNGDFTDASSNGNDLTAQNSAVATDADNPWNATEYGIITNVTSSTIQVFCPEGYGIPNETLTAPFYSTQSAPYGFPRGGDKWEILVPIKTTISETSTSYADQNIDLLLGVGAWETNIYVYARIGENTQTGPVVASFTLSSDGSTETNPESTVVLRQRDSSAATRSSGATLQSKDSFETTATTTFSLLAITNNASAAAVIDSGSGLSYLKATCAYL